ncbi:MAG TPA: dTDP-4-dehydrorhamnose 3,5-epimerase family protein [Actinomycetota bacterium]|nr:dTDP-4-dehydrorhamnose 3,5-epimerase family protein [Actinomycetota bacterium]
MTAEELTIPGVLLTRLERHEDERGWFSEILREDALGASFVQSNHSRSRRGVLRGLHYHRRQADAWYVVAGTARVGLADLRERSDRPTAITVNLSADDPAVLYIPPRVAHGFYAVTELDLVYWVTHYYDNSDEHSVAWNDPVLAVPWDVEQPILSGRDADAPPLDWEQAVPR